MNECRIGPKTTLEKSNVLSSVKAGSGNGAHHASHWYHSLDRLA